MGKDKSVKIEKWAVAVMLVLGVLFYFVPGEWISIESDSMPYIEERGRQGILPGYPIFLSFFRAIMDEQNFLNGVVVAQSVLAIVCTLVFVMVLQKQFELKSWECILLYIATMLPFSIYLPESGITHQIMTEGIAYAIFYLYFITVLKAVWTLKFRWYVGSLVIAYVMGLIRTQMLFLQAVSFLVLLWIVFKRVKMHLLKKVLISFFAVIIGIIIAFGSYKLIYATIAYDNQRLSVVKEKSEIPAGESIEQATNVAEYVSSVGEEAVPAQFDSVIISRGFFEADKEDVALFEDEMMKQIFLRTYELADADGHLHHHVEPGLYMWEDLVYDRMSAYAGQAVDEYDEEHPGVRERSQASIVRELGLKILIHHFDRYLYHVIRLMIPSFIASVFFQIRPIYLLCHFVALFIYLFAVMGAVWSFKQEGNRQVSEYVLTTVVTLVVMIVILNLVFIGLQRYVVYGMGIFYCSIYLMLKEICKIVKSRKSVKSV